MPFDMHFQPFMPMEEDITFILARHARRPSQRKKTPYDKPHAAPVAPDHPLKRPQSASIRPVNRSPTQATGDHFERLAADLIMAAGCEVLGRQLRCRFGEIDLAVRDGDTLAFVEVRARASGHYGGAAASVGVVKQKRLARAARWWLGPLVRAYFNGRAPRCRFDLVTFDGLRPAWIRDAFFIT